MRKILAIIFVFGLTLVAAGMTNAQMMGNSHAAMNQMMENMMDEEGEKQDISLWASV